MTLPLLALRCPQNLPPQWLPKVVRFSLAASTKCSRHLWPSSTRLRRPSTRAGTFARQIILPPCGTAGNASRQGGSTICSDLEVPHKEAIGLDRSYERGFPEP